MFAEATAVDALAVAAGSTHAIRQRNAMLDLELITRLRSGPGAASSLRGPSGVDDEQPLGAVRHGQTKINIGTLLKARPSATVPQASRFLPWSPASPGPPRRTTGRALLAPEHDLCVALRGSMWLEHGPRNGPRGAFEVFELVL
jgi:hypothetical protein